jgi:hypothetical protein
MTPTTAQRFRCSPEGADRACGPLLINITMRIAGATCRVGQDRLIEKLCT